MITIDIDNNLLAFVFSLTGVAFLTGSMVGWMWGRFGRWLLDEEPKTSALDRQEEEFRERAIKQMKRM